MTEVSSNGFKFAIDSKSKSATIKDIVVLPTNSNEMRFPSSVEYNGKTLPVVGFAEDIPVPSFNSKKYDLFIPSTIKNLPHSSDFHYMINSIHVDDDHPTLVLCDGFLLDKDRKTLFVAPRTERVVVPANVSYISEYAFYSSVIKAVEFDKECQITNLPDCFGPYIEKISCPDSLSSFGTSLANKYKITSITFHNNPHFVTDNHIIYTNDHKRAVYCLRDYEGPIALHDATEIISASLFYNTKITDVTIPSSLKVIEPNAFKETVITSFVAPPTLESIGQGAFQKCSNLEKVEIKDTKLQEVSDWIFSECTKLKEIEVPDQITKIGIGAFAYSGLRTIDLSHTKVESLEDMAFEECLDFQSIQLPETVESIKSQCFDGCLNFGGLELETLPKLKEIGQDAFSGTQIQVQDVKQEMPTQGPNGEECNVA